MANLRNGSTGQLSVVTWLLLFVGAAARIFTSVQETGDTMMVLQYALSTLCNGTITFQIFYYWNSSSSAAATKKTTATSTATTTAAKRQKQKKRN